MCRCAPRSFVAQLTSTQRATRGSGVAAARRCGSVACASVTPPSSTAALRTSASTAAPPPDAAAAAAASTASSGLARDDAAPVPAVHVAAHARDGAAAPAAEAEPRRATLALPEAVDGPSAPSALASAKWTGSHSSAASAASALLRAPLAPSALRSPPPPEELAPSSRGRLRRTPRRALALAEALAASRKPLLSRSTATTACAARTARVAYAPDGGGCRLTSGESWSSRSKQRER